MTIPAASHMSSAEIRNLPMLATLPVTGSASDAAATATLPASQHLKRRPVVAA